MLPGYRSSQTEQSVKLLAQAFGGASPSPGTNLVVFRKIIFWLEIYVEDFKRLNSHSIYYCLFSSVPTISNHYSTRMSALQPSSNSHKRPFLRNYPLVQYFGMVQYFGTLRHYFEYYKDFFRLSRY